MSVLRGPVLWPAGPRRLVALDDGVVAPELPGPLVARRGDPPRCDGLIVPAFSDWHFHWVQMGIAGVAKDGAPPLLDWLRDHAWPAEERFADAARCRATVPEALRRLAGVGTVAGAAWASPHDHAASAFLDAASDGFVCGPASMTTGEPASLVRAPSDVISGLEALHARHGGRLAVTPRFALSCDASSLRALGRFAEDHGLLVQTHLAESADETATVRQRHGTADYLSVYEDAGLVGRRTLLAHAVHATDAELARIAESGACVVHCPTSNRALGSGRMPLERVRESGVRWVFGSDVGAGPNLCMLDVLATALDVHGGRAPLAPAELLHRSTLGRLAIATGNTESESTGCGMRAGALVIEPPPGLDLRHPDPDRWFEAILDEWRMQRRFVVRRAIAWPAM